MLPTPTTIPFYNKHTCREVSPDWTHRGWLEVSRAKRGQLSSGNFQPPEVRPIPDSQNLQVCLVFITCHFGKILKSTDRATEEFTHFSI